MSETQQSETENSQREAGIWLALLPVAVLLPSLWWCVTRMEDARPALVLATVVAALIGRYGLGFRWRELEQGMVKGIKVALPAILILMAIGVLIGLWVTAGVVPLLIVYGLELLSPEIFLPACCLICALVSLATGSSWATAGTVGVALIGVASGLGVNLGMAAGAIISGAYFGDKMSPLSETTNLAPAVAGSEVFEHIRHMIFSTGPSFLIALVLFAILGLSGKSDGAGAGGEVDVIVDSLGEIFTLSPLLLLPPILVLVMVVMRVPALPAMLAAAGLGGVFAIVFQQIPFVDVLEAALYGYTNVHEAELAAVFESARATDLALVDELLSEGGNGRGGLDSVSWTISLVLCAMLFGGVMERTGMLSAIARGILRAARSTGTLISATIATCLGMNVLASDQYLSIIVPGRMFREAYDERGLDAKNLSRALEDAGTITSPLIFWNTCGATMYGVLGVGAWDYWMFCFFNLINPVVSIILGFTGWTIVKKAIAKKGESA